MCVVLQNLDSWNEMLAVKERLAIEIKQIVEKNKHLLLFQVSRFISKKNDSNFLFSFTNFKTLFLCCNCKCINKLVNSF